MNKYTILKCLTIIIILLFSCDKNPVAPNIDTFLFPLSVGNRWEYNYTRTQTNIISEEENLPLHFQNVSGKVIITVTGKATLYDTVSVYVLNHKFIETLDSSEKITEASLYYYQDESGLYFYGLSGEFYHFTSDYPTIFPTLYDYSYTYTHYDSIVTYSAPKLYLEYPMKKGNKWGYNSDIIKKISDIDEINCLAGNFICFKVDNLHDSNDYKPDKNHLSHEYISNKGLIKKIFKWDGMLYWGGNRDTIAVFDQEIILELSDVNF